ncbi:hypothetical protein N9937_00870 [bacterium]|nr:hypothetical protein [bacterium]
MTDKIKVEITGFNTIAEAEEFCSWYSGQGEQDASMWFECRKDEGRIQSYFMPCQSITTSRSDKTVRMEVKQIGED